MKSVLPAYLLQINPSTAIEASLESIQDLCFQCMGETTRAICKGIVAADTGEDIKAVFSGETPKWNFHRNDL
jgi:hypothetical protein